MRNSNRLLQLLRDNARAEARQPLRAEVKDGEATVYVYDVIVAADSDADWWGGVSAESFVKELRDIDAKTIHLRINSPGGDVFGARAMEAAIREHPANIVAHIDGYAASAASYIAVACDEVEISQGGMIMIHNAWSCMCGNADDMRYMAGLLDKIDGTLVKTYAAETGCDPKRIKEWMADETWFNADEAVENGFADRVAEAAPKASASWNLAAYSRAPAAPARQEEAAEQEPVPAAQVAEEQADAPDDGEIDDGRDRYERMATMHEVTA